MDLITAARGEDTPHTARGLHALLAVWLLHPPPEPKVTVVIEARRRILVAHSPKGGPLLGVLDKPSHDFKLSSHLLAADKPAPFRSTPLWLFTPN